VKSFCEVKNFYHAIEINIEIRLRDAIMGRIQGYEENSFGWCVPLLPPKYCLP